MDPYYQHDNLRLYHGDCREVLAALPESSVDFVVTDPPYSLHFMEKEWDKAIPGPEYWRAIARVCKPGALLLAFGGTRTYHRLVGAIDDAGWEIRDCLMWLYGQGMPKCGDIGKLIDKSKGANREVVGTKLGRPGYSLANHGRTNRGLRRPARPGRRVRDHGSGNARGRPLDRLGDGVEAGLGADCPGDEAAGRHDCL